MEDFKLKFIANFITDNRWKYFTNGLGTTYVVSFFAVILGVVIGVLCGHRQISWIGLRWWLKF